ncbi:MAG: response regulator [Patescibacteria group bacterium]
MKVESSVFDFSGLRAIVVEDEPALLAVFQRNLTRAGIACQVFADPDKALREANFGECDFCLIDQGLPGMPGLKLAGIIKKTRSGIQIILISGGQVPMDDLLKCTDSCLAKPFQRDELLREIARILNLRQSSEAAA